MDTPWHARPVEDVLATLDVAQTKGLSAEEVERRRKRYGPNTLQQKRQWWFARLLWTQLTSPLVLVLLVAALATAVLGEWLDTIVIAVALLVNLVVGVVQEGRASRVFETLAASQEVQATVLRDGEREIIPAAHLVPGDIVYLEGGNAAPADLRLITANNLSMSEAALTGEWLPVAKATAPIEKEHAVNEQKNMAWSGTSATTGHGVGVVVSTGSDTAFGKIARDTQDVGEQATPLQRGIRHLARILTAIIIVAIIAIAILGLIRGEPLAEMLLVSIAIAVAAVPSGLPAAVTIVLAIGMEAVLRKGGLVKNLLAVETLGSTTAILTDKTGTLTEGVMTVSALHTARSIAKGDETLGHDDNRALLETAILSSDAYVAHDEAGNPQVHGRPIERAIVVAGLDASISQPDLFARGNERLDFLQFESARRYSASLNAHGQGTRLYLSGSPEHLLAVSERCFVAGTERELDDATRAAFQRMQEQQAAEGYRFIAVAYRANPPHREIPKDVEEGAHPKQLVFVGLIGFSDKVRDDVADEIARAKNAGIRVAMVTGDYAATALSVARDVGIADERAVAITGSDIAEMNDRELLASFRNNVVFARVLPNQKLRMARVLKAGGEVVAMTGDGVNDAPALVAADIGVAVGSGTDVAKEASDLVLLDNTFSTITAAVAEGRRVIANLRKIVAYLLSTSFSEIIVIGSSLAVGLPLPLLPGQILWAKLVEEGFMSFPFAFEPAEKGSMNRPPLSTGARRVITPPIRTIIIVVTAFTGTTLLALYGVLLALKLPIEEIRTIMFVALSLDSIFFALSFKNLHRPLWRIPLLSNLWVFGGLCASITLLIAAVALEPLRILLTLTPLTALEVLLLAGLGLFNLFTIEVTKRWVMRKETP